ncbi:MAG TPA: uroporphyrinogen decarboxylase family protein [Verrucomicrobiae bacterium]|nr:uroporphyrinogen decarboxylase family protein [Verrucomicrobiae bacterium]
MTGKERVIAALRGNPTDRPPVLPIIHSAYARLQGVPLGQYYSEAKTMAKVIAEGCRRYGFDGVQLSMGVTGEAEALGAHVEQPSDGSPLLKHHPLKNLGDFAALDPAEGARKGRMPTYFDAVHRVADEIGQQSFILSTLRGPLNIASQLRGVEAMLMDLIDEPESACQLLDFTTEVAIEVSRGSLGTGADALLFGEATCSPNFISPGMYREFVQPRHARLIAEIKSMGWRFAGFHICGDIRPIFADITATGAAFLDIDYQVPAQEAIALASGRIAMRGNLDPSGVFLRGSPDEIQSRTTELRAAVSGHPWILGSGCDVSPGVPETNLAAFATAALA